MIVQFSCRGERLFARKRSWLESHAYYAKNGTIGAFGRQSADAGQSLFAEVRLAGARK